ncbi:MAG: hypothetical protein H6705_16750 [Myxococcales bacterium]|nr:hypothetical protein [Myxococcales bacterium]
MANDVNAPPSWPASAGLRPNEIIFATDVAALFDVHNFALAYAGTGPAFQQTWPDEVLTWSGDPPEDEAEEPIPLCRWRIPLLSDAHTALVVEVRGRYDAGVGAGGATVTLRSRVTGDTVTADLPALAGWVELDPLELDGEVDRGGDRFDEVELFIASTGGGDHAAVLSQIAASWPELASPLADDPIDDAPPLALDAAIADNPLSTPFGHGLLEGRAALARRPRMGVCWSGIDPAWLAGLPAEAAALVTAPVGIGVLAADASNGLGVVAHVRQGADAGADRIYPLRPAIPPEDGPAWLSQHERAQTGALSGRYLITGTLAGVGAAIAGLSIWTREDVTTDAELWGAEVGP